MNADRTIHNLALIGFMGTGKSTAGRMAARRLRFDFVDTDVLVELRAGKSVAEVFVREGEAAFREYERQVVSDLATRRGTVIATGGGLGANPEHLASLKAHALVVCLWAPAEVINARMRNLKRRPLLQVPNTLERIRELLGQRTSVYQQADVLINTASRHSHEIAQLVIRHFLSARRDQAAAATTSAAEPKAELPAADEPKF